MLSGATTRILARVGWRSGCASLEALEETAVGVDAVRDAAVALVHSSGVRSEGSVKALIVVDRDVRFCAAAAFERSGGRRDVSERDRVAVFVGVSLDGGVNVLITIVVPALDVTGDGDGCSRRGGGGGGSSDGGGAASEARKREFSARSRSLSLRTRSNMASSEPSPA